MNYKDTEKYRAEARRKIAEAEKQRRQGASASARPNGSAQRRQVKPKGQEAVPSKPAIETWDGLNTKEKQAAQEARARKQNQQASRTRQRKQADAGRSGVSGKAGASGRSEASSRSAATGRARAAERPQNAGQSQAAQRSAKSRQTAVQRAEAETPREKAQINERLRKIQHRRNKQRAVMLSVLVALVLIVTATLIYLVMNQRDTNANLQFIYEGSVTQSYGATALVVRDEVTIQSSTGGTVVPIVPEGYYARVGEDAALIIGADMNDTLTELENYRRQISDVQLEMIATGKVTGASIVYGEADKQLEPLISNLRRTVASNRFGDVATQMEQIDVVLAERTDNLSEILYDNAILDTLYAEKAVLEQRLAVNSQVVRSTEAGLISFAGDGLEVDLDSRRMNSITSEEVAAYIKNSKEIAGFGREVVNGQAVLRQVTGIDQYFAMVIPDISYSYFTDRKTVDVYIPSEDLRIDGAEIVNAEPRVGAVYLILKTDKALAHLLDERTVQVEIIANEMKGLRVPLSALRRDETDLAAGTKLIIVSEGYYKEIDVAVMAQNGSFAIVESLDESTVLRQGSLIVLNPNAVRVGSPVND